MKISNAKNYHNTKYLLIYHLVFILSKFVVHGWFSPIFCFSLIPSFAIKPQFLSKSLLISIISICSSIYVTKISAQWNQSNEKRVLETFVAHLKKCSLKDYLGPRPYADRCNVLAHCAVGAFSRKSVKELSKTPCCYLEGGLW